ARDWRDLRSGSGSHKAVDDDAVVCVEAAEDDAQPVIELTELDDLRNNGPIRRDRHDHMLRLIGHDGSRWYQQDRCRLTKIHDKPRELTRRNRKVGIRHGGTSADRAAAA